MARFTRDSLVLNNCKLSDVFETWRIQNGWLLGNSVYSFKPWFFKLVASPVSCAESNCNNTHVSNCCITERRYGIWKMRFRCLHSGLTLSPKWNIDIALPTAGFQNICIRECHWRCWNRRWSWSWKWRTRKSFWSIDA
jgi:hypothetical protein